MDRKYDFGGYATKNDIMCLDGRVISRDAFKDQDNTRVPLVWGHNHKTVSQVLGHADLENRPDGVYCYCSLNNTQAGQDAKESLMHGDLNSLSIWANNLKQRGPEVVHGVIREVSLVLAGANDGAKIDSLYFAHGGIDDDEQAVIQFYDEVEMDVVAHSADKEEDKKEEQPKEEEKEEKKSEDEPKKEEQPEEKKEEAKEDKKRTLQDVLDEMTDEQRQVTFALISQALNKGENNESKEDDKEMKHNVFDAEENVQENVLSHDAMETILADGKKFGSLKDSFLAHAAEYGIDNIDYLFPDYKNIQNEPEFIKRKDDWVSSVMGGVHHTPFSRIRSMAADITADDARAKGYTKGNRKIEEVFTLLRRTTEPCTVYKKQKLDHDDIKDITSFDVVAWVKKEMRGMLDEEIARAILVGDGRSTASEDKIPEDHIRPIWKDDSFFSINRPITFAASATDADKAKAVIKEAIKSRKDYRGSGSTILFTTEDWLTEMLLIEDGIGHKLYKTEAELATAMRVGRIIPVAVMENLTRTVTVESVAHTRGLIGIIVDLSDYNVGADKGGNIEMFDDFDIDYNQQKYLMETRMSGALTKYHSAIIIESDATA